MCIYIHVHLSQDAVSLFSKENCKKAYVEAQGLVLFGSKMKLTPIAREGKCYVHVHEQSYYSTLLYIKRKEKEKNKH